MSWHLASRPIQSLSYSSQTFHLLHLITVAPLCVVLSFQCENLESPWQPNHECDLQEISKDPLSTVKMESKSMQFYV